MNLSWKVLNSSKLLAVLFVKNAELLYATVQEQLNKPNKSKKNLELIQLPMVKNLIKSRINYLFWPDQDLKINML